MMTAVALDELVWRHRHELFIYPWEMFELRIQEEMVRSDRSGSSFVYMELRFNRIEKLALPFVSSEDLWKEILRLLTEVFRGSDLKGYLEGNSGIGIVLLDSIYEGAQESGQRILNQLIQKGWFSENLTLEAFLKITLYPESVHQPNPPGDLQ